VAREQGVGYVDSYEFGGRRRHLKYRPLPRGPREKGSEKGKLKEIGTAFHFFREHIKRERRRMGVGKNEMEAGIKQKKIEIKES